MSERDEVYAALTAERDYQDGRWDATHTSTCGRHSVTEFLVFIEDYVSEAKHHLSRNGEPGASEFALHSMRKIGALAVACMEQHGAKRR